jgi:hypothetical protein
VKTTLTLFLSILILTPCFAQDNSSATTSIDLKNILNAVNNEFLKPLFINNYINNKTYFIDTDLSSEDLTKNFKKAQLLLRSMQLTVTGDSLTVCAQGLSFYDNYLALDRIKKGSILREKYNKENLNQALKIIEQLPLIEVISKLNTTKIDLKNTLSDYASKTTGLIAKIDFLKKKDQDNPQVKTDYMNLEKQYISYPYLVKVIRESKNSNNYKVDLEITEVQPVKSDNKAAPVSSPQPVN